MLSLGLTTMLRVDEEASTTKSSSSCNWKRVAPSRDTQAEFRLSLTFLIIIWVEAGKMSGLKLRE